MASEELRARLKGARRVVIKAGTSVVSTPEGYPSLVRLANIVEQVGAMGRELTHFFCGNGGSIMGMCLRYAGIEKACVGMC
jgi:hypothetical protein